MSAPAEQVSLLATHGLSVDFRTPRSSTTAVDGWDLEVRRGEVLALVGESGSGKSVCAMSLLGLLPPSAHVRGRALLEGRDLLRMAPGELRTVRGRRVSMIFQEPMTALNPTVPVGRQVEEVLHNHGLATAPAGRRAAELLAEVGIPEPGRRIRSYPHELSGGQRQRVMIAMALACEPDVLVADEPTTALDVTVQAGVLDLLRHAVRERGTALLLITHNMGVVADLADRVAVVHRGAMVEVGDVRQVLTAPRHEYTRQLLAAVPRLPENRAAVAGQDVRTPLGHEGESAPALDLRGVSVDYHRGGARTRAVDDVSLTVGAGEILGLVGESGSGKSTLGRAALGLLPAATGQVHLLGHRLGRRVGHGRTERSLRRRVGVVFQDPGGSLDPRMSVGDSVGEPMVVHRGSLGSRGGVPRSARDRRARVAELLDAVRLPLDAAQRYPHELSGGQRQRVALARAISLDPELLVADEPTSALDVSVQAEVLDVLRDLQRRYRFACLFISHDLAVVHSVAHRVAVMRHGGVVELGTVDDVLLSPRHPYSRELLASVPVPDPQVQAARRAARQEAARAAEASDPASSA